MLWLQCLLGNGNNRLQLSKKYEVYAESNGVRPEQPWRHLNPWLWTTKNVLPGETNAKESPTSKTRRPSHNPLKMVRRWKIQEVAFWHRMEENTTSYCTTGSPWRRTSTRLRELKEFLWRRNSASSQSTTRLCSSEKRLHDEHLARTQQEYRDIPRSQRMRQRKRQQFEGNEDLDYVVDSKTGWRFHRQSRWNLQTSASSSRANLQAASSSSSTGDQTQWNTSNWNSQHSSKSWRLVNILLRVGTGFVAWSQATRCVNGTPINTARTELHRA